MIWLILAVTFSYGIITLSFFFPGKFIQFKVAPDEELKWVLLGMTISAGSLFIYML